MRRSRDLRIIDLHGLSEKELKEFPTLYNLIYTRVRPQRLEMKDKARREKWWLFGRSNQEIRDALSGLDKYIGTCRTAKHRVFVMLNGDVLPDAKIVAIGLNDSLHLGILSSSIHLVWAIATGGWLGVGNDSNYNHSDCFNKFPFPTPTEAQKSQIRELGERLDAHRKRQQSQYPDLTLTDMYNVLEKERAGEKLNEKERRIHQQGLIGLLRQLHDELDAAVAQAYGWPADLPEAEILERLVQLNAQRAAEEAAGQVRWLRPEYQAPTAAQAGIQGKLLENEQGKVAEPVTIQKQAWPEALPAQAAALRDLLEALDQSVALNTLAAAFEGKVTPKRKADMQRLLETMAALGQAELTKTGWWKR